MDMWTVFTAAEHETWRRQLDRLPRYDVYHEAGYHQAYETDGLTRAHAYVAEIGGEILFHPIMIRPIETVGGKAAPPGLCDAETGRWPPAMTPPFLPRPGRAMKTGAGINT